ncbi:MAG: SpoIIE family protein phosphatase, partial [Ktedonobacteraceae bacterium]|nr:SpoIIE family protein phosphatase [Ktedonobacteraceae bacterium]
RLAVETISDAIVPLLTVTTYTPSPPMVAKNAQGIGGQPSRSLSVVPRPDTVLQQWIRDAVQQANRVIYHCNADYDTAMSSTLTTALIYKRRLYMASVGDSRIYHYNASQGLHCLNSHQMPVITDQSPKADELAQIAQQDQQRIHYLGQAYHVPIETLEQEVAPDDLILLCTNGLWQTVKEEFIKETLARGGDPQALAHQLIEMANTAGGQRNVSVTIACVQ